MAWQQNQKMLANLVRFLSKSQGKGHRWEDQSWEGASWDMNKGKGKGKATSGKGKGKGKGKADGEAWEAPWRNATASPTPKDAANADAEDEGPWICLKCYTSHDHPGGWKMKRCRHCRANKHSTRDDNKANKEHKEQPPSLKETTLRNRYKTLNEVDADGETVGNMEEQAKYEDDNNYHLEAIADAKVKGWTEVAAFHQKILDQMKPPMPLQPLKDLQYFNNRQIQAESAHRKRIEGLNTNIKDSQDKIEKLKGDQESKLNMMKEEYDKSVAAQKDAFKKAINMLEQGILEAQTQITTSTAEHQATCAEIRDTIDVINSKTHTASTKYQQQRQHEDRKKKTHAEHLDKKEFLETKAAHTVESVNKMVGISLTPQQLQCILDSHMQAAAAMSLMQDASAKVPAPPPAAIVHHIGDDEEDECMTEAESDQELKDAKEADEANEASGVAAEAVKNLKAKRKEANKNQEGGRRSRRSIKWSPEKRKMRQKPIVITRLKVQAAQRSRRRRSKVRSSCSKCGEDISRLLWPAVIASSTAAPAALEAAYAISYWLKWNKNKGEGTQRSHFLFSPAFCAMSFLGDRPKNDRKKSWWTPVPQLSDQGDRSVFLCRGPTRGRPKEKAGGRENHL